MSKKKTLIYIGSLLLSLIVLTATAFAIINTVAGGYHIINNDPVAVPITGQGGPCKSVKSTGGDIFVPTNTPPEWTAFLVKAPSLGYVEVGECVAPSVCSNNIKEGTEVCDGSVPSGVTCATQLGASSTGSLSCNNTCSGYVTSLCCTPAATLTRTVSCPSGQTGTTTQQQVSTCPGPVTSAWATTSNTCAGLSWSAIRYRTEGFTWYEAKADCDGRGNGWRLPTLIEIHTLVSTDRIWAGNTGGPTLGADYAWCVGIDHNYGVNYVCYKLALGGQVGYMCVR